MIEQLAAIANEPVSAVATPGARDRDRRRLLERAAGLCAERGERLVLVIDGIDEDVGAAPDIPMPSIARYSHRGRPVPCESSSSVGARATCP